MRGQLIVEGAVRGFWNDRFACRIAAWSTIGLCGLTSACEPFCWCSGLIATRAMSPSGDFTVRSRFGLTIWILQSCWSAGRRGLVSGWQTSCSCSQLHKQDPSASPAMIRAAVKEDFAALEKVDLQASFDNVRRRNMWILVCGLLVPAVALCAANPAMASLWARRWFAGTEIRWPQQTYLSVVGLGDADQLRVPRGEATLIEIDSQPEFVPFSGYWKLTGRGEPLLIEGRDRPTSKNPDSVLLKMNFADGTSRQGTFTQFSDRPLPIRTSSACSIAEVTVTGGDDWFGPLQIVPVDRPECRGLTITAQTPGRSEDRSLSSRRRGKSNCSFSRAPRFEVDLTSTQAC